MNTTASTPGKPQPGTLYLVPAPLDFGCPETVPLQTSMPDGTLLVASRISTGFARTQSPHGHT